MSDPRRSSAAAETALVVAGFSLLALAVTYPLVFGLTRHLPNDLGDPLLNAWILAWDATGIGHGFRGIWDAPIFFPYRDGLAYSENLLGIAVFTAPIQWLTNNPVFVYNVAFLGSFVLAGGTMYLLARTLTGRRDAAIVAGLVFAFTPYRVAHIAHLQMLMWGWLPLSLWALHRYAATGAWRFLLVSAGGFLLQSLSNGYFMYFSVLPLTVVGLVELWCARPPLKRTLLHLGAAVVLLLVALAPMAQAYYRVRQEVGLRRRIDEIVTYSADVGDYFRAHRNVRIWRGVNAGSGEHELFPGGVALLLAAAALLTLRRGERPVLVYGAIAASAFVLSLGPQPAAWGHHLAVAGPYKWLLAVVPGLDGLRGVARLNMVVVLALAVLAAFGARRLLDRVTPSRRPLVVAALGAVIVAEGLAVPIPTPSFDPRGDAADREAYRYLARSAPGAVLEMPIALDDAERELKYHYMTLEHHHPIVNGHSGYETPLLEFLDGGPSPFNEIDRLGAAIDMLRALGVRYIVMRHDDFKNQAVADALTRALETDASQVEARQQFGKTAVFTLAPAAGPPAASPESQDLRLVPASAIRPSVSHTPQRLALAFDGNRDSRWLSGERQSGREWIELQLDRARDVRLVRMQTAERSFGDYPRELAIDLVEDAGTRTVFQGSVLPQFARGLLANHNYPNIDLVLPENRSQALRLRQLATTHSFFWSIHELQVWESSAGLSGPR